MAFDNPLTNLIIPAGAHSGQSRIVAGPDVPVELQNFHPHGASARVTAAILFYDESPNTNSYLFLANVENPGGFMEFWIGTVSEGEIDSTSLGEGPYPTWYPFGLNIQKLGDNNVRAILAGEWTNANTNPGETHNRLIWTTAEGSADNAIFTRLHANDPDGALNAAEDWHNITPQSGWTNFGNPYPPLRVRKVASPADSIQLGGLIGGGDTANGKKIGDVPSISYFPNYNHRCSCYMFGGAASIVTETPVVEIRQDGGLYLLGDVNASFIQLNAIVPLT